MSEFFGPLDSGGRVPPRQQTRVAAFLVSAHGALARQFALALELLWLFLSRNLLPFVAFAVVSLVWPAGSQDLMYRANS